MCVAKKLNLVDMYGIGLMLEHLVAEGNITCEERDRVILRIARENDIAEYMLSNLAGYGRSKQEVLERAKRRKGLESQGKKQEEGYISLTEVARAHSEDAPGYVIQSWLRSGNTLAFLNLWEQENNPNYSGENDQHINRAIAQNPSIREIHYYCAPAKVSDPVEEFEVASRFSIKAPQKLMLESWNTIWNIFEQN